MIVIIVCLVVGVIAGFFIGRQNPILAAKTEVELEAVYEAAKRKLGFKP